MWKQARNFSKLVDPLIAPNYPIIQLRQGKTFVREQYFYARERTDERIYIIRGIYVRARVSYIKKIIKRRETMKVPIVKFKADTIVLFVLTLGDPILRTLP